MRARTICTALLLVTGACFGRGMAAEPAAGEWPPHVTKMNEKKWNGPDWPVMRPRAEAALRGGAEAIVALVDAMPEPGTAPSFMPRYTLSAIGAMVGAPGKEKERGVYAEALSAALDKDRPKEVQKFILLQLQFVGDPRAANAVARFLERDRDLAEVAVMALKRMGGASSTDALRKALPAAKEPTVRAAILRALGELGDAESAPALVAALSDSSRDLRIAAAHGLAALADPASADVLRKAADVSAPFERGQMRAAYQQYIKNRLAATEKDDASKAPTPRD